MGIVYRCDKCLQLLPDKGATIILSTNEEELEYDVCEKCFGELKALFIHENPEIPSETKEPSPNEPQPATEHENQPDQAQPSQAEPVEQVATELPDPQTP